MVDASVLVAPGVAVGVEVHQGERPEAGRVGPQQGQGDEVVAADGEHGGAGVEDVCRVALDAGGDVGGAAVVQGAVSGVDDGDAPGRIEAPRPRRPPRELRRSGAHRARPQTGAGAVGGREVEGDAGDRDVDSLEIAGVRPPQEAERTGVGRLVATPVR